MNITGKVHCFFEQSGTFKNEFIKLGIPSEDYDIQNNFGETDHVVDLFAEIDKAYDGKVSVFDKIGGGDLIMAFFPCIHFCDAKGMLFRGVHISQRGWSLEKIMRTNIERTEIRERFFKTLLRFVAVCSERGIRLIIENPWNTSRQTFLQCNFIAPSLIDTNRCLRGDYFVKPTAYWFINCEHTYGRSYQVNNNPKIVYKQKDSKQVTGICSEARSMISPDYARNFICDFVIGKVQDFQQQLSLF